MKIIEKLKKGSMTFLNGIFKWLLWLVFHGKCKYLPTNFETCINEKLFSMEMFLEQLAKSTGAIVSIRP